MRLSLLFVRYGDVGEKSVAGKVPGNEASMTVKMKSAMTKSRDRYGDHGSRTPMRAG